MPGYAHWVPLNPTSGFDGSWPPGDGGLEEAGESSRDRGGVGGRGGGGVGRLILPAIAGAAPLATEGVPLPAGAEAGRRAGASGLKFLSGAGAAGLPEAPPSGGGVAPLGLTGPSGILITISPF